jgi:hypothetical protein
MIARRGLRRLAESILFLASLSVTLHAQTVALSGHVVSLETNERIPSASIAILGPTTRGVKANREGAYRVLLSAGDRVTLRTTALGYRPDTLEITLTRDSTRDIRMRTLAIEGGTVTVTADRSRSEGRRIMHRVIDTKDTWQNAIDNYRFQVYSRINLRTDADSASKVLAILETVADGFWSRAKGYAERVIARKQTANLPVSVNKIALFDLQNFYNDRLDLGDYTVISPVAKDAFDRYDFDLLGTGELNGSPVYKISVEPLNTLFPAFAGTIWIDQSDYTIAYLDLSPNDAIKIGPLKNVHLTQTFNFVQNKYWLPNQLGFNAEVVFDLPLAPRLKIEQNAVLQDYVVNSSIPDSIFARQHSVAARADSVDAIHWAQMRTIPLAVDEEHAYTRIDSMVKLPPAKVSLSPTSILFAILTQPDFYQFNRVEGSRLQFSTGVSDIADWPLSLDGTIDYSFGQQKWKYSVGARQALLWKDRTSVGASLSSNGDLDVSANANQREATASIGISYFNETLRRGEAYSPLVNTLTALLLHNDYPNYYDAKGFSVDLQYLAGEARSIEQIYFRQENSRSDTNVSNFSLLLRQHTYRMNPRITDGLWNYAGARFNGTLPVPHVNVVGGINAEYGWTPDRLQTYYVRVGGELSIAAKLGGWGDLSLAGSASGILDGDPPLQKKLFLETHDGPIRSTAAFHTLRPFEFEFNNLYQASIEQDFYDLPMRLIGVTLPFSMHWIGFADYASFDPTTDYAIPVAGVGYNTSPTPESHVTEVGFGLGGILNVLRVDAAWRLTQDKPFVVTGSLEFSF